LEPITIELELAQAGHHGAQISQHKVQNNQEKLAKNHHKCHGKKLKSTTTRVAYHHKVQGAMEKIHGGRKPTMKRNHSWKKKNHEKKSTINKPKLKRNQPWKKLH